MWMTIKNCRVDIVENTIDKITCEYKPPIMRSFSTSGGSVFVETKGHENVSIIYGYYENISHKHLERVAKSIGLCYNSRCLIYLKDGIRDALLLQQKPFFDKKSMARLRDTIERFIKDSDPLCEENEIIFFGN